MSEDRQGGRSIFRNVVHHHDNAEEEKKQEYRQIKDINKIVGIPIENVPQAIAGMNKDSLETFLSRISRHDAINNDGESIKDNHDIDVGETDEFSTIVALCAQDDTYGQTAIANLLDAFQEFGHPEYAIFSITNKNDTCPHDSRPTNGSYSSSTTSQDNEHSNGVAEFLSGQSLTNSNNLHGYPAVAGILDASGSMDQVADSIHHLVYSLGSIPIWSCFSANGK